MWKISLNELRDRLDSLRRDARLTDAELALAIYELIQSRPVAHPTISQRPDAQLIVAQLARWMFVRAPALRPSYFVISPMTLDLIMSSTRSLDETLDDLATLEHAAHEGVEREDIPADLEPLITRFQQLARHDEPRSGEAPAAEVTAAQHIISQALDAMRLHKAPLARFTEQLTARLFDDFGKLSSSGALRELFGAGALGRASLKDAARGDTDDDEDAGALSLKGKYLYEQGELGAAIERFNAALARDPRCTEALIGRGVIRATVNDLHGARADLDAALRLQPDHATALVNRGLVAYAELELDAAIQDFSAALEADPALVEAYLNRSSALAQLGRLEEALEDVNRAVTLSPDEARPRVDRAVLRRAIGDAAGAIEDYAAAITLDAEHTDAWAGRGFLLLELGEVEAAEHDLSRAIALEPWRNLLFYNRGNARAEQGRYEEAVQDYDRAIELDDEDVEAHINRGTARMRLDDVRGALEDWDRAIRLDPYQPNAYLRRGVVLLMSEEYEHAAHDLARALEVAPPDWPLRQPAQDQLAAARAHLPKPN